MYPYIPHTEEDVRVMLKKIGVNSVDDLFHDVPETVSLEELDLPSSSDEHTVRSRLERLAEINVSLKKLKVFTGAGVYRHFIPSVVRHLSSKPGFVTAYTPYQAEVSQGTLQALFEYQTMICELTGMEVSNASMYDGASALAEAALMAVRISKKKRILVSEAVHPEYLEVVKTYTVSQGIDVQTVRWNDESGDTDLEDLEKKLGEDVGGVLIQYPNFFGIVEDLQAIRDIVPSDVPFVVSANPIALAILKPPGEFGADIVVGEGQPLGIPPNFGGPGFGFFATRMKHIRKMPGRIIGMTRDVNGRVGYVMILQAREQHIRRGKATSNICSNHALSAVTAAIYMSVMGKNGLMEVARRSAVAAHYTAKRLKEKGIYPAFKGPFFNEFAIKVSDDYEEKWQNMINEGILGPLPLVRFGERFKGLALVSTTELTRREDVESLLEAIS